MPPIFDVSKLRVGAALVSAAYHGSTLVSGGFSARSVVFEGDNYITRAAPVGVTNSKTSSFSFWFKPLTDSTSFRVIKGDAGSRCLIQLDSSKKLRVTVTDGVTSFSFRTTSTFLPTDPEAHIAISFDVSAGAGLKVGQIMRNGVSDYEVFSDTGATFTPIYNLTQYIGSLAAGASSIKMTLREFMWWPGVFIDWTSPANLAKVYSSGAPVNVGNNGELVTGTQPAIYLSLRTGESAGAFLANRGTGGSYTQGAGPTIAGDKVLIGYGDSITFGTGATIYPSDTWMFKVSRGLNTVRQRINYGVGGEGIAAIRARFVSAIAGHVAQYPDTIYTLEGGYNSIANGVTSIVNDATTMINAMNAAQPGGKWIFLGIPNGNLNDDGVGTARGDVIVEANSQIAAIAGERFLDLRQWLIDNGLAAASLTATADDLNDIAAGIVPRSLRMPDLSVHHNNAGQISIGVAVRQKLQSLGFD